MPSQPVQLYQGEDLNLLCFIVHTDIFQASVIKDPNTWKVQKNAIY